MRVVEKYKTRHGKETFSQWIDRLEETTQARIYAYIVRLAGGGAKKNVKPVGGGVSELKIDSGPGYRVYFGQVGNRMILLLLGGGKRTQQRDIRTAMQHWKDYHAKNKKL